MRVLVTLGLAGLLLGGCSSAGTGELDTVREAARRTALQPRHSVYVEATSDGVISVETDVADDFRVRSVVSTGGEEILEEVVVDDDLAVRTPATVDGWRVDLGGAPSLIPGPEGNAIGSDPLLDAADVLSYLEVAFSQAERTMRYNPESLDYTEDEDTFRPPAPGETRYDVVRPSLSAIDSGGAAPGARSFRRMAVYIRDGYVTGIEEDIDVVSLLDDIATLYGTEVPEDEDPEVVATAFIGAINALRTGQGNEPIRLRTLSVTFTDIGSPPDVTFPEGTEGGASALRRTALQGELGSSLPQPSFTAGFGASTPPPLEAPEPVRGVVVAAWLIAIPAVVGGGGWFLLRRRMVV